MTLSQSQLLAMQALVNARLPDTCTITRASAVSDGAGGTTDARAPVATVPCNYGPEGHRAIVVVVGSRVVAVAHWAFTFPAGTDVRNGDRLTVGARTWTAIGVASPESYQVDVQVRAEEQE